MIQSTRFSLILLIGVLVNANSWAQPNDGDQSNTSPQLENVESESSEQADSIRDTRKPKLQGFPIAFYSPETRFAAGAVGFLSFRWRNDSLNARASSITIGGAYTQNRQVLFYLPYNLSLKNDQYRLTGEIGYFKYNFSYFGIGNDNPLADEEMYEVTFPRLRLNAYKKIGTYNFVGLRYAFDRYKNLMFQNGGALEDSMILGTMGGINSSIGIGFISDRRDHQFYPRSGTYTEINVDVDHRLTGSHYQCIKMSFNFTYYLSLGDKSVVAANFNSRNAAGEIPFYGLSQIGGTKRLRGQFEGQQRDVNAIQSQIEYRQEFLKNWGFTVFGGTGMAYQTFNQLTSNQLNFGYGAGLRYKLDKKEHVNIRLDVGFGGGRVLPYFTISEAF